jgi:hypothetical protein
MIVDVPLTCDRCGKRVTIPVDRDALQRWQHGELIQKALPELTPGQREMFISGLCEACFDEVCSEDPSI